MEKLVGQSAVYYGFGNTDTEHFQRDKFKYNFLQPIILPRIGEVFYCKTLINQNSSNQYPN